MNYIDTSLVVTALDSISEKRSKYASKILGRTREKVVSQLFLLELASAISRKPELIKAVAMEENNPASILLAYLVYLLSKYDLKFLPLSGEQVATPFGRVNTEIGSGLALAADLKLRSLDLLHVAQLLLFKDRGYTIESLLTSDADFLRAEKFLEQHGVKLLVIQK
jgi:predicted nucleic acid-binding protein